MFGAALRQQRPFENQSGKRRLLFTHPEADIARTSRFDFSNPPQARPKTSAAVIAPFAAA
jgi:hypothetical protein